MNVFSDYYDRQWLRRRQYRAGVSVYRRQPLYQNGVMGPAQMRALALALFAAVALIGLGLVWVRGWPLLLPGAGRRGAGLGVFGAALPAEQPGPGRADRGADLYGDAAGRDAWVASSQINPLRWPAPAWSQALLITALLSYQSVPDRRADSPGRQAPLVARLSCQRRRAATPG